LATDLHPECFLISPPAMNSSLGMTESAFSL
jgi:hypothetical protein